jgi:hypothetical protein
VGFEKCEFRQFFLAIPKSDIQPLTSHITVQSVPVIPMGDIPQQGIPAKSGVSPFLRQGGLPLERKDTYGTQPKQAGFYFRAVFKR